MHAPAQQSVQLAPRLGADALQPFAAGADDDGLLAGAVHPDHRGDHQLPVILAHRLDFDGNAVGHFLVEFQRQLLADELGDAEALVAIGDDAPAETAAGTPAGAWR